VVRFPAIAEADEVHEIETILEPRTFTRRLGEALHPEREPLDTLERIRRTVGEYNIHGLGPIVKTHRRHFRQQSRYTVCAEFIAGSGWQFARHQDVFDRADPDQDQISKIIVPATERLKALSFLSTVNINAFSLFDSEESLMELLAFEHIDFHRAGLDHMSA